LAFIRDHAAGGSEGGFRIITPDIAASLLSGLTLGLVFAMLIAVLRGKGTRTFRGAAVLFGISVAIYALAIGPAGGFIGSIGWLRVSLGTFVCGSVGYYGVLIDTVFQDRKPTWRLWLPTLSMIGLGVPVLHGSGWVRGLALAGYVGLAIGVPIRAGAVLYAGKSGDLDENRRRLRYPIAAASLIVAVAIVLDVTAATASRIGLIQGWHNLERLVVLAALTILVAVLVFDGRNPMRPRDREPTGLEDARLQAVLSAMSERQLWRREGLTLGALSQECKAPEHVVRRLILDRLGHRNFPAFVNAYRIEAACHALAGSDRKTTVAAVAFDVGFSSLSAFNRAFRDVTGETPTQWRSKQDGRIE